MSTTHKDKQKERCELMIAALVGKHNVAAWWAAPNRAFKYKTPFLAFELDPDEVHDYLAWHCYGAMG